MGFNDYGMIGSGATGYLYLKNGSKSRIENGKVIWTKDRNGNITEYTYDPNRNFPDYNPRPIKIKDSINREIEIQYAITEPAPYGLCNKITFKGTGGQERAIRVSLGATTRSPKPNTDDELDLLSLITTDPNDAPQVSGIFQTSDFPKAVWLPDGRSYKFEYNVNGRLARVELPTGGYYEYDFYPTTPAAPYNYDYFINRLKEKRVYDENSVLQSKTVFSKNQNGSGPSFEGCATNYPSCGAQTIVTVETFDGSNNLVQKSKHYFHGGPIGERGNYLITWTTPFGPFNGKERMTENLALDGSTVLTRVERKWRSIVPSHCYVDPSNTNPCGLSYPRFPNSMPVVAETRTTLVDANLVSLVSAVNPSTQALSYDQFNNQTDVYEYDFGAGQPGSFKRRTHTDYVSNTTYTGAHLRSLPSQTWVSSDISGNSKASLTQFEYDDYTENSLVSRSNVTGHDTANFGIDKTVRGNITKVTTYENAQAQTGAVSVKTQYDILGNVVKTIDANGYVSELDYIDRFGSPDNEARSNTAPAQLNGKNTFAFATSATNAMNWVTGYAQFDYFTSAAVNTEDLNGIISKTLYNDPLDRLKQTVTAIGTALEMQTNINYEDDERRIEVKRDLFALNDNLSKSESFYDGLGRTFESRKYESDGGYIVTKTEYDALGRVKRATNPYRPLRSETVFWTESKYDALGRAIEVKTPDNAKVLTDYLGNVVTVTDQAGKQRRSITNALGHLMRVDEPTDSGGLGAISSPNQKTEYEYDVLNNLKIVTQGVQTRTFLYDSLSRLKEATNPESGTIKYTYDANGNLQTKRDARGIKTVYDYDELNRIIKRCYRNIGISAPLGQMTCAANTETPEANTPDVSYTYENTTTTNLKGILTKVTNEFSTTEYLEFDALGRVTKSKQTTDNMNIDPMTYTYNLSGALVEQKYPSGRVVRNVLDADGDLANIQSKKNLSAGFWNYAQHFTYTAAGAVSSMQFGNGRWESTQFNSRLQPIQIALGSTKDTTDKLKLNFTYTTTPTSTDNNGSVLSQTITVPTEIRNNQTYNGFTAVQIYTYDSLNRIKTAEETIPEQAGWKQTFKYDRYGNRNFNYGTNPQAPETTLPSLQGTLPKVVNPEILTTDNRFKQDQDNDGIDDYLYDAAGNTTKDALGRTFIYDAENKQTEVKDSSNQSVGTYFYDGDGKRVKKVAGNEVTIFVYNTAGKLVAEYANQIAQTPKVSYLTSDHLGSQRINTNANGNVTDRHDYQPFGEEILRASSSGDSVRKKFTSYERDSESRLDFAQARYFNSAFGRFSSPDPSMQISLTNPQSWNKYIYAFNNPHKYIDKDGRWPTSIHDLILKLAFPNLSSNQINAMQVGSWSVDVPWTMFEKYVNQHAMRRTDQTVEDAKKEMDNFIAEKNDLAQANNDGSNNPSEYSLYNFGQATHPIMDNTSPTHRPFQEFDNSNMFWCVIDPFACLLFRQEVKTHTDGESTISSSELNQAINDVRENYRKVYGDKALNNAVGIFSNALLIFDNAPINGSSSRPSGIKVDNLGAVTVYPDGREKYEGPLKKVK
jgi:RHS repeat-associated protein